LAPIAMLFPCNGLREIEWFTCCTGATLSCDASPATRSGGNGAAAKLPPVMLKTARVLGSGIDEN